MANTLTFANQTLTDANIFGGINYCADLNTGDEFTIGNTASASVSFITDTQLPLYTKDQTNGTFTWTQDLTARGRYYITEVTKVNARYNVKAYDAMSLLDTNISALSLSLPMTASAIATDIATFIGCTVSGTINNGTLTVSELASDMTIRTLLGYIAEASGCSVKIDAADQLCFMYYASSGITVTASQYKKIDVADYTCAAIDTVTIYNSAGGVIATYGGGTNVLYIQQNPFLEEATAANAQTILNQVSGFAYAPLTCELFTEMGIEIGTIATFGSTATLVMHVESSENGAIIASVGSDSRAEYNRSIEAKVSQAGKTATAYITEINDSGITIHAEKNTSSNYAQINANGMEIYQGGNSVSSFGSTLRIGKTVCDDTEYPNSYLQVVKNSTQGSRLRFIGTNGSHHLGHIEAYNHISGSDDDRTLIIMGPGNQTNSPKIELQYDMQNGTYALILDAGNSSKQIYMDNSGIIVNGTTFFANGVTIGGHSSAIGTVVIADGSGKSLSSGTTFQSLSSDAKLTLPTGTWVVSGTVTFSSNTSGRRAIRFYVGTTAYTQGTVTATPVSGSASYLTTSTVVQITGASADVYLEALQNSGGALTATCNLRAARIA